MALADFDSAYLNPLSSVLAAYVYNSLLTGRPYFLQMIEDVEIAMRFSRLKLGADRFSFVDDTVDEILASRVESTLERPPHSNTQAMKWSDLLKHRVERWPIHLLLPGGAYIR